MLKTILAASAAVFIFSGTAHADISADLKFCAGLKVSKERLACYDAAARIEKHSDRKVVTRTVPAAPVSNAMAYSPPPALPKSRFDGAYVGVTAGYEIPMTAARNGWTYSVPPDSLSGPKFGAVVGYNVTSDRFLAGIELRGQYLNSNNSASSLYKYGSPNLPHLLGGCYGCTPTSGTMTWPGSINLNTSQLQKLEIDRRWQADISVRGGVIVQDWLIFAKAGLGAEETRTRYTMDQSGSKNCINPIVTLETIGMLTNYIATGCGSISSGPVTVSTSWQLTPIAIFGLGVERNFGDYFARAEAEMTAHLVSGGAYYTPSVNLTAGYRF